MECDPTRMCERLVGLGDVEVLGVDDEAGEPLRVHIRRRGPKPDCGDCGALLWSDGERPVELVDLPAFGRPARLVLHKRRWRCPRRGCPAGTVTEQDREIAPPRERLTARAGRWATRQAGRGRPVKDLASDGTDRPLPCGVGGNVGRRLADQCAIPGEVQTHHAGSNQGPTSATIMQKDRRAPGRGCHSRGRYWRKRRLSGGSRWRVQICC